MYLMEHKFELEQMRPAETFGLKRKNYALFLGRFSPEKNCHLLIEAFEQVNTSMQLVFAGGSSYTDEYVSSLRRHESDRIRFLPWLSGPTLEDILTGAALFVLPSDMEGMSLALLDAMGASVCVLASDVPENVELIADAGFTFRAGDVSDLREKLNLTLADATLREHMGRRGRERVRQHYLWDGVANQMSTLYCSLTGYAKPARALREKPAIRAA
jgi:glycosyltransferase involved in cell wall biosynthesis